MIAIALPALSARLGRPVLALAEPPLGLECDEDVIPPGALVLRITVPSVRFMAQMPAAVPGAACYDRLDATGRHGLSVAWERWADRLLVLAIAEPRFCEADVQVLGRDRELLVTALLRLWSWLGEHADEACPAPDLIDGAPRCGHFPYLPTAAFRDALRFLAGRLRLPPHEILDQRFDAFVLNWRVLKGPRQDPLESPLDEALLHA